jgi:hypothetical protein
MNQVKYPIGLQDFEKIRENGFLYVDKTQLIHQLILGGTYYFLSRPRRFGKSLLLSTLKSIFAGKKQLFKGLWIEDQWDWNQRYSIIHFKFSSLSYHELGLRKALSAEILAIGNTFSINIEAQDLKGQIKNLLEKAAVQHKVVLLIDEYDKPIIDFLEDQKLASENHQILKEFFSVLKDADPQLAFVLITGVSKFSKVSIFSDLNNLNDITLHPQFATLTGITHEELNQYFEPRIQELALQTNTIRDHIKAWYNGYSWDGMHFVYNPFSLLRFMDTGVLTNYWFETGTPTFLVKMVRQAGIYQFNEADFVSLIFLSSFEPENLEYLPLLFQTGYLTFSEVNFTEGWCKLRFPNQEVKASFEQLLLGEFIHRPKEGLPTVLSIRQALLANDIPSVMAQINASFSSIPAELWRGATELHYHALVHLVFNLLGNYLRSEVHSSLGRCDALVETPSHVYAFEFKLDETAALALAQIEEKAYLGPYLTDPRVKVAIGVNFSKEMRKIAQFLTKELSA